MSSVNETLQQLVDRRLREMGRRHGRTTPLSLREAYQALPEPVAGREWVTYELVRRVAKGEHSNIGDRAADTLATMLGVDTDAVHAAARQRPRLGPFELPERADRLNEDERRAVLQVIEVILDAGERVLRAGVTVGALLAAGQHGSTATSRAGSPPADYTIAIAAVNRLREEVGARLIDAAGGGGSREHRRELATALWAEYVRESDAIIAAHIARAGENEGDSGVSSRRVGA